MTLQTYEHDLNAGGREEQLLLRYGSLGTPYTEGHPEARSPPRRRLRIQPPEALRED